MLTKRKLKTGQGGRYKAVLLLTLGLLMMFTITFPTTVKATTCVYTMTAFTNTSESNMYIYESYNATHYGLLKGPAYTPPASDLIRDPGIMKHTDGLYYVVYTTNWSGNTVGIASSPDKMNWTFVRNITLSTATPIAHTWAPEWFKDTNGSVNIIVSLSPGYYENFKPHVITASGSNLASASWSPPAALTGLAPIYIDTRLTIGSFIRHYNYQARMEASVSPAEDAQFRIVPGLANAMGISFESMNYPGYFLRNNNGNLNLVKNDGSAAFRNDATFRRVDGLANASWTSYTLFNHSNLYLRHDDHVLRLEPVVTALDKSDATFREIAH